MPFAAEFDDVYEHLIRSVLEGDGYSVARADEAKSSRNMMHDVIQGIVDADLIVADLSGANPNVYYELGLAHAYKKQVILLTQDIDEVPFDLRAYRVVTYSTHFARVAEAKEQVLQLGRGARDGSVQFGSPVSDFGPSAALPETAPSSVPATPELPLDDYGPLDVAADLSEGLSGISTVISEVGTRLNELSPEVDAVTQKMTGPMRHDPSALREVVRSLARHMDGFASWLKASNGTYRGSLRLTTEALDTLFKVGVADAPGARSELPAVIEMVDGLELAAAPSREQMAGLAATLEVLPRVEKEFNRAKRSLAEELHSLVSNIDQTIAVMSRARAAARQFLSDERAA